MKFRKQTIIKLFTAICLLLVFFGSKGQSQMLDVKKFGARGDGKSDDTQSIQAAIDAAKSNLNDTIFFPTGTYLIGKYTITPVYLINYFLKIHAGIIFKGEGKSSIIKLREHIFDKRDTMANAHIFYGVNINNVGFNNLLIDMNGANNLVPEKIIKNNMAIFIENGSNISIKGVTIKNCSGTNMIAIRGTGRGLKIENSFFYNGGNYVGTSTPNKYQIDFSFIYSEWDSTTIINNHIEQQNVDIALNNFTGGVELHGSYSYADNNTIIGCNPGFYISSTWHPMEKTTITKNKIEQCLRGISFWVHYPLNNITISNNNISLAHSRLLKQVFITGIDVPNGNSSEYSFKQANGSALNNLLISGNTINSLVNDTTQDKTAGIVLHSIQNSRVENNSIVGMNYGGLVIQGSKWGMRDVTFDKNSFSNFKPNNDAQAVAGYVVVTDTYSTTDKNSPGIKDLFFTNNTFARANVVSSKPTALQQKGKFFGAFIALPGLMLNEIHFDKNMFTDNTEKIVTVKID